MTETGNHQNRSFLQRVAHNAMLERGLLPDFPPEVIAELNQINEPAKKKDDSIKDLRHLLWCSIDNDDSKDLDQLTVAEKMNDGVTKVFVAIADVDALVKQNSAIDIHASHNTTSIYTPVQIFPMLPEKLSTDLTSLNYEEDRIAVVFEMVVSDDGNITSSDIYRALVCNKAKLAYKSVSKWLDGDSEIPENIKIVDGLDENIRLQYNVAQKLKELRHLNGALDFDTRKAKPIFEGDNVKELEVEISNSSKDLIEDFMIAANGVSARYLASKNFPSIRRVVRTPKRWSRIVELAKEQHFKLPDEPDSKALVEFLAIAKKNTPDSFPDLSLSVIKLLGPGEYVIEIPGDNQTTEHFGLAVKDYSHSTAPNRRYPDLITHRLLKAAISGKSVPYTNEQLEELAKHCTDSENAAKKVERQVEKSTTIILLESKIGQNFDAIVTGVTGQGTWVRVFNPPIEGKLVNTDKSVDVGDKLKVQLIHTDVNRGFIDFKKL